MCHQWFADIQQFWLIAVVALINGERFFDAMLDRQIFST